MGQYYYEPTRFTASGAIYANPCVITGIMVEHDGANDPEIEVHNAANGDTAANRVIPKQTVGVSDQYNGVMIPGPILCRDQAYLKVASLGSGAVYIYWRPK